MPLRNWSVVTHLLSVWLAWNMPQTCIIWSAFYRVMLCICGTSHGPVSVSVTSRSSAKTAKYRITQATPHNSPGTLVFWRQRSPWNFTGATRMGTPNAGGWVKIHRRVLSRVLLLTNSCRRCWRWTQQNASRPRQQCRIRTSRRSRGHLSS